MQEFYTLVTNIGVAAIANATILGQKVNITNFAVGDGAGNYYTPTAEMTELKREVWRGKPTSVEVDKENLNIMVVSTVIPAEVGGFTIREMALFTENGKMIAISNCPELQKVTLGTGVASELALTMQIAVSNAETIEFKIDPTVIIATKSDVEKAKDELEMPTFDDSGTVPTIQSFTDFVNSIKSKMNIFEFYRNFKSGMKYILDTGRIVNNVATDREDMVLSAAMGKYLQEQIDQQNNNLENKIDLNNTGFFIGGAKHFAFLQIKQEQNVTRLQIESNEAKIYKSTDGAISFPYCEKLITNSDINIQNNTQKIYLNSIRENVKVDEPHNTFYVVRNDFCFVSLSAIRMTSSEGGIAFVGLPNPVGRVNFTLHRAGDTSEPVICGRLEDGFIYFNFINNTLIGIHGWCSFCYPIAK